MNRDEALSPLFTDLYELTMMFAYRENHLAAKATFSLFIRGSEGLNRGFLVAAGLEDALSGLENMRFSQTDMDYLRSLNLFPEDFIRSLSGFRFTGDVWAMPEGTICFADEPLMEVTAPIAESQIVETFLINTLGFQTNIATKALRCMHAAKGRPIVDFSFRRTQGLDAGMQVARNAYISGFNGTSNVLAGKKYGIPVSGTMAHSFVLAVGSNVEAFRAYARSFPDNCIFLIDTHDVIEGAHSAVEVALAMAKEGHLLKGVRIDSGEMVETSKAVRRILNDAGLDRVQIIATSGFDEFEIEKALSGGAAIDAFGVGTKLGVSADAPYLDMVYKLARYDDRDVRKTSPGKITLAGEKQVFRIMDRTGKYASDTLGTRSEMIDGTEPLLIKVMENGRRILTSPTLQEIRKKIQDGFSNLDGGYKSLDHPDKYPIRLSPRLSEIQ
ncbi:MAG: nicotinate phosphoribosyltransferase [Deltaproteobacteria bacterium]|nr:nicotinate phosphoribosyltransferase [Deltaproteobacteria bacterium]